MVIPTAGQFDALGRTLSAVSAAIAEAGAARFSVLLVEDSDQPTSAPLVRGGHQVLRTGGVGSGPARNAGAEHLATEWVVFIDDDVVIDPGALRALTDELDRSEAKGVLGQTRAPSSSPAWLRDAYEGGILGPRSVDTFGARPSLGLVSNLWAVERDTLRGVGGYPDDVRWGMTDIGLGARLTHAGVALRQVPDFSGVHQFVPTWDEWLSRRERMGRALAELADSLDADNAHELLATVRLAGGPRSWPKRAAARVPPRLWRTARGRQLRRLAAAGVEARAFRNAVGHE